MNINRLFYISVIILIILCLSANNADSQYINRELYHTTHSSTAEAVDSLQTPLPNNTPEIDKRLGAPLIIDQYRQMFRDSVLDSLIYYTIKYNKNVLVAINRMEQASASRNVARSAFYPQLNVSAGWKRSRTAADFSGTGYREYGNTANILASASWEIDIFGTIRNKVKSSSDLYKVSVEEYFWAIVSMCNKIASAYVDLRTYQQRYIVTENNVNQQKKVYDLTLARFNAGLVSKVDVAQALSVYRSTQAALPQINSSVQQTINTIYLLLGMEPPCANDNAVRLYSSLSSPGKIPAIFDTEKKYIELKSILDRPDIKADEYTVNSAFSLLKSSRREWYPQFFLNGEIGFSSKSFKDIMRNENFVFSISPSISFTLFDGLSTHYNAKMAKAAWEESVNNFNESVLTALAEVDNALIEYDSYNEQEKFYTQTVEAGIEALELSIELYKQGLQAFQTVLDAQRSLLQYQNTLVSAHGAKVQAFLSLVNSLGIRPFANKKDDK